MSEKYLMRELYNVNNDIDAVGEEIERMLEQLRFRKNEILIAMNELSSDHLLCSLLKNVERDLNKSIGTLESYISVYNQHIDDIHENADLCRRVAKGGIEDYES